MVRSLSRRSANSAALIPSAYSVDIGESDDDPNAPEKIPSARSESTRMEEAGFAMGIAVAVATRDPRPIAGPVLPVACRHEHSSWCRSITSSDGK
jgi:hypothetical protein